VPLPLNEAKRAYHLAKQSAERIVDENIAKYKQNVAATIEYELIMMKKEMRDGNDVAAGQHKIRIEIYNSILERI
jgi:hypothetical protein